VGQGGEGGGGEWTKPGGLGGSEGEGGGGGEAGGGTGGMGGRGGGKGCENVPPPHSQQKFVGCKSIQVYFSHASEGESAEPNHSQRLKPTAHC